MDRIKKSLILDKTSMIHTPRTVRWKDKVNENSLKDIREFFGTPDRPVNPTELKEFWQSLTDEEKNYYKSAPLG